MFSKHFDAIRPGATPERVLALCQAVYNGAASRRDIVSYLYLDAATPAPAEEFADSLRIADQELGIIALKDGEYKLTVSPQIISSTDSFRKWASKKVFLNTESTFFLMTRWFNSKNEAILDMGNWEDKAVAANREGIAKVDENCFLGWRFWASFLGEGYILDTTLIPNMYVRIRDILSESLNADYKIDAPIPANEFFNWLFLKAPEANIEGNYICLALSNALRTLRDRGEIEIISERDALKKQLFYIEEDRNNDISHIVLKEAIK